MNEESTVRRRLFWVVLAVGIGLAGGALATTWADSETDCPVCRKKVEVMEVASFGSYIYRWPSRLQMIFWPATDGLSFWFCKHCHAAWMMGDLRDLGQAKRDKIEKALAPLRKPQPDVPYNQVPLDYRLAMARAVYGQLDENEFFWSHFHRVRGYHLEGLGQKDAARAARTEALAITEKALAGELDQAQRKELLLVKGAMQYLTGKPDDARETLKTARAAPVEQSTNLSAEKAANIAEFLDEVIDDLVQHVARAEPLPR